MRYKLKEILSEYACLEFTSRGWQAGNIEYGIWNTEYGIRNSEYGIFLPVARMDQACLLVRWPSLRQAGVFTLFISYLFPRVFMNSLRSFLWPANGLQGDLRTPLRNEISE